MKNLLLKMFSFIMVLTIIFCNYNIDANASDDFYAQYSGSITASYMLLFKWQKSIKVN